MRRLKQVLKSKDNARILEYLNYYQDDLDHRFTSGEYAAHLIAQSGNIEVMKTFLQMGGGLRWRDNDWRCPLAHAVRHGHIPMAEFLIANGLNVNNTWKRDKPIILLVIEHTRDEAMLHYLISAGVDILNQAPQYYDPLYMAISKGWARGVEILLAHGADPERGPRVGASIMDRLKMLWTREIQSVWPIVENHVLARRLEEQAPQTVNSPKRHRI